ncbi:MULTISPECIES: response regulator [Calothrix]|uniref:Response regulator n=2 Tax=Calothrix TaxID=1186 RepID=A0ABR8AQA4_9CYAN|nr:MULTISPECIES: response regulator [Calothrix]MBD2200846.1 response regulator [Calothrix parietina FACHB-288]MBD2229879.1 response regulator [Calothrix anomala FACHB-343]
MKPDNYQKPKVLIADDDASYRLMLTLILEERGWEVSTANNGREAIRKVLAQKPDLLILDYQMPVLTGGEVYQNLQSNGIKLPVVLVSSESALEKLASSLGIADFLHKPFDVGELITIVQSAHEKFRNY